MIPELSSRLLTRQISPSSLWSRRRLYLTPFTCAVVPVLPAQQNRISSVNMFSHTITCLQPLQLQWAPQCAQVLWESVVWLWAVAHVRSTGPSVLTLKSQQPPLPTHTHTHTHITHISSHLSILSLQHRRLSPSLSLSLFLCCTLLPSRPLRYRPGNLVACQRGSVNSAALATESRESGRGMWKVFSSRAHTHTHTHTHTHFITLPLLSLF